MKKYMKHANRGLLLTAVVLVIMIIYIIVDYIQFATQKSAIQDVANRYIEAVFDANLENKVPETAKDNYAGIVDQYFTENYNKTYYLNHSSLQSQIEQVIQPKSPVAITEAECQIKSISVKKSGTGSSNVHIEYSGTFVGRGDSIVFSPGGIGVMSDYDDMFGGMYYEDADAENTVEKDYTKNYNFSYQGEANMSLKKENGTWKIASLETSYYNATFEETDGQ